MTSQEIKKVWNKMKKGLIGTDDALHLKGCMYMTSSQIEKRTATIDLGYVGNGKNAAEEKARKILNNEEYRKFAESVGVKSIGYEVRENPYYSLHMYMRINY